MVLVETTLDPAELLRRCLAIERDAGRERRERWGPRTLDLDIVRFGERVLATAELTIPHPELPHRPFWQRELAELDALVAARG
jgi:2-amino-4-hydroxy-6-hydroxymethyldihydropteridine diphosphokinase